MSSPESNGATQELAQEHPDQDTTRMDNIENTMRAIQSQLSALLTQQPTTGSTHSTASDQAPITANNTHMTTAADNNTLHPYVGDSHDDSWNNWNNNWWKVSSWNDHWSWQEDRDKPMLSHIVWPTFVGNATKFHAYKYAIQNLLARASVKDYKYVVPRVVANVTGSLQTDFERIEFNAME